MFQFSHRGFGLTDARKNYFISLANLYLIICNYRLHSYSLQCILHALNIASIVFYYCYHNIPFVVGKLLLLISRFTAILMALAKALKTDSIL